MTVEPDVVRRKLLEIEETVLSDATAKALELLAGFRNVLVHDYADVDMERVVTRIARLGDFEAFVADVERWLQSATR